MKSVGIDIVEIERIAHITEKYGEKFLQRIYTDSEIAFCRNEAGKLAALFAAKEAVSKALGVGLAYIGAEGILPGEVEVSFDKNDTPRLKLLGETRSRSLRMGLKSWGIDLYSWRGYAIALAMFSSSIQISIELARLRESIVRDKRIPFKLGTWANQTYEP